MNNNNENPMATQQDNNSASAYPQQENSSVYMQQSASTSPYVPQENDSAYPQQTGTPSVYPQQENSAPLYTQKEIATAPYMQQSQMYGAIPFLPHRFCSSTTSARDTREWAATCLSST